ncbi:hypothetical protein Trydic_g14424 [Trypoxylus dichotomus]
MGAEEFYFSLVWVCQKVSCNDNLVHLRDLQSLITSVRNELTASIAQLREDFNANISALTAANGSQHQSRPLCDSEDVIQEVMDRQSRKNNIIIFGVAEQHADLSTNQRNERERATVDGILSASDPSTQLDGYKLHRLGRFNLSSVRPCPIKLTMLFVILKI